MAADPEGRLVNPYLRIVFGSEAFRRGAELRPIRTGLLARGRNLHLHWPEYLLYGRFCRRSVALTEAAYSGLVRSMDRVRRGGGRLVWTAHNLAPHGFPSRHGHAAYRRWSGEILGRVDTVVAMSDSVARVVKNEIAEVAGARFAVIPHPHYRAEYRAAADRRVVRACLRVPEAAHLTCAVGLIRPYKQVPELIAAFAEAALSDEHLLVAGPCDDPALRAAVERAARRCPRLHLRLAPLPDADFAGALAAADLFVANFETLLNSGSVIAALSLATPVIARRGAALVDLQAQVGAAWLALFDGRLDATELRHLIDASRSTARPGLPDLGPNEPDAIARAHLALYT